MLKKIKSSKTIRSKLLLMFMIFGLIPIIIGGVFLYFTMEKYLTARTYEELSTYRETKAKQLELFFRDRISEVNFVASSEDAENEMEQNSPFYRFVNAKTVSYPIGNFAKDLSFLSATTYYEDFSISDGKMVIYGDLNNCKNLEIKRLLGSNYESLWIRTSIWKKTVMQDYKIEGGKNKIYISSPIIKNGKVVGMFTLSIAARKIEEILLGGKNQSFGETGDVFLVGRDYLLRTKSIFSSKSSLKERFNPQVVMKVFSASHLNFSTYNLKKRPVFASAERLDIPFLNWALFVTINRSEALKSLKDIRYSFLLILFISGIGIYFFALIMSQKIARPIGKLKEAASEMESGEMGIELEEETDDEIGSLTRAFNKMAKSLRERTRELKEREERLFHFYSATSDGIILYENESPVLVNRALARLTGYSRESLLQKKTTDIISEHKTKFSRTGDTVTYETLIRRKDGSLFPAEIQERKVEYRGKPIDACVIRDITKRKEVEKELEVIKKKHLTSIYDEIEKERQRLARELHDGLGQALVAVQLEIQHALEAADIKELGTIIESVISKLDKSIEEIRSISNGLRPAVLSEFGLSNAIKKLCLELTENSEINFLYEGNILQNPPDLRTTSYLYRITQEALNNVIKYSDAEKCFVALKESDSQIFLSIEDNGVGFDPESVSYGNGIRNMFERVKIIKGKIAIDAKPKKGVKIVVTIKKEVKIS